MNKKAIKDRRGSGRRQELQIVYKNPAALKSDPRNARQHSKAQIAAIRKSIREFGFNNPVLLKPGDVIGAGNGRAEAAIAEGLTLVPTITIKGLSDVKWRAYALADNQLALTGASWNSDVLKSELTALATQGLDISLTGFSETALRRLDVPGFAFDGGGGEQITATFEIMIECNDEKEQETLLARFNKEGLRCKALLG